MLEVWKVTKIHYHAREKIEVYVVVLLLKWMLTKMKVHKDSNYILNIANIFYLVHSRTCEICGSTADNIAGEQTNQSNSLAVEASSTSTAPVIFIETQNLWHGRRIMNFLLACMVFAFVISWLFHFKVLSWISRVEV